MIDSQKTNFSKMALSLRQNNMNPNPLALFHDICRHIKCHLRNQNRRKFHFSNMGPHCAMANCKIFSLDEKYSFHPAAHKSKISLNNPTTIRIARTMVH